MELTLKQIEKRARKKLPNIETFENRSFVIPIAKPFDYSDKTFEGVVFSPFYYEATFDKVRDISGYKWEFKGITN